MQWAYISRKAAIENGYTHEGRMFGCPAWFAAADNEYVRAVPKLVVLSLWCHVCNYLCTPEIVFLLSLVCIEGPIEEDV